MKIIDGRKIRNEILEEIKKEAALLSFQPVFCDVLVGQDPVSEQYVNMKARTAEAVGIKFHHAKFPAEISTEGLIGEIKKLNAVENMCGIIIQLPLPAHIDRQKIFDAINPELDVDCLGKAASEKFYSGGAGIGFPTALSCMALLDSLKIDLKNKNIAVLGQGMLVGRPVTALLRFRGAAPAIVDIKTPEPEKKEIIKKADVIISGIGRGKHITGAMIKLGAIIIDAGTSESDGGIVGDADFESLKDVAGAISPVPGGVGPVTVAMLLKNVLSVAKARDGHNS